VRHTIASLLCLIVLFLTTPLSAGIYRYEDDRGVVHFTNCPRDPKFKLYIRESKEDVEEEEPRAASLRTVSYGSDSNDYDSLINECSRKYAVDSALIKAMIRVESGFDPFAISKKGARGLMQLMPETAKRLNVSNTFNPRENIDGGVRHFKYLLSLFNHDVRLSLAAYNAGENLVLQTGSIPPYRETRDYVVKVLNFYQTYKPSPLR
jgi:soluble lytic murein transglycosylase-like protein